MFICVVYVFLLVYWKIFRIFLSRKEFVLVAKNDLWLGFASLPVFFGEILWVGRIVMCGRGDFDSFRLYEDLVQLGDSFLCHFHEVVTKSVGIFYSLLV